MGDADLVRGVTALFNLISLTPPPPYGICFSAALQIAIFAMDETYLVMDAIEPAVILSLMQWISRNIRNEPMNAQWWMSFRHSRFHTLMEQARRLLGVILYRISAHVAHQSGFDALVDEVVSLVCIITERVFLQTLPANFPIDEPFFRDLILRFSIEVLALFRLLRLHRDVNANRQNTLLSIN